MRDSSLLIKEMSTSLSPIKERQIGEHMSSIFVSQHGVVLAAGLIPQLIAAGINATIICHSYEIDGAKCQLTIYKNKTIETIFLY